MHVSTTNRNNIPDDLLLKRPVTNDPNRPLRVAMLGSKGIPASVGGVERIVEELSARLVARGHEVTVYSRRAYTGDVPAGHHRGIRLRWTASLPGKYTDTLSHALMSTIDALGRGFDILHIHSLGNAPVIPLARLAGARVLFHVHGQEWKGGKWGPRARSYFRWCEGLGLSSARQSVVNTAASHDDYRARYGRESIYIPNAVEMPEPRVTGVLERLGIRPGSYLLFVGRLVPEKGCHYLIDAHRRLDLELPLVICGEPAHSEDYARQLKASAGPRVVFAGTILGEELTELYAGCWLLVNPTERDAVSLVLLEAMAQGAPVLASDIPEMVEGLGGTGFHFRARDADDLTRVMAELLAAPDRLRAVGAGARERVRQVYAWPAVVDQFEAVYRNLMAGPESLL
ncbi:MAG: glycosyltransferase family 4 protein [Candidatus Eisenbacteria bacterium]|nr:glycosyltransferase family 4 protein [Candidatus Eisenbacteria bacterium]